MSHSQTEWQAYIHTYRQTDRQTDRHLAPAYRNTLMTEFTCAEKPQNREAVARTAIGALKEAAS